MADDPSTIAWRLQRLEEAVRDLGLRVVSVELYTRDRAEVERDLVELRAALADEKQARKEADRDEAKAREKGDDELSDRMDKGGSNWRQAIYSGAIPSLLVLASILVSVLRGGK